MTHPSDRFSGRFGQAPTLASLAHAGVPRQGTVVPYIMHPVHVARLLERHGFSEDVVIAGLLHDVLEDARFESTGLQTTLSRTFSEFVGIELSEAALASVMLTHRAKPCRSQENAERSEMIHRRVSPATGLKDRVTGRNSSSGRDKEFVQIGGFSQCFRLTCHSADAHYEFIPPGVFRGPFILSPKDESNQRSVRQDCRARRRLHSSQLFVRFDCNICLRRQPRQEGLRAVGIYLVERELVKSPPDALWRADRGLTPVAATSGV